MSDQNGRELSRQSGDILVRHHREVAAGGYACRDGSVDFYQRVCALLPSGGQVLDLGAGRGAWYRADDTSLPQRLLRLDGRAGRRVGADVDPAVRTNPALDEAVVIDPRQPLPFEAGRFDLVLSDWVAEHVETPRAYLDEVRRVLRPGGWFCARTPNRWAYFAVAARLLSGGLATAMLRRAQAGRLDEDVFPKFYRMNTLGAVDHLLAQGWRNASYTHNPPPGYHGGSSLAFSLIEAYQKLAPRRLATVIHIFAQRLD
jgi:SAM-dependent methyltransferase